MAYLVILFFLSNSLLAQEIEDIEVMESRSPRFEENLDEKIEEPTNELTDELLTESFESIEKNEKIILPRKKEENIYEAILFKNALVTEIKTNKEFKINKQIFVRAKIEGPKKDTALLFDKNGELKFLTKTKNLKSIDSDLALYPQTDPTIRYHHQKELFLENDLINYQHNFSLEFSSVNAQFYKENFSGATGSASTTGFFYQLYLASSLPFKIAPTIGYAARSGVNDETEVEGKWQSYYYGIHLIVPFYEIWQIDLVARKSWNYQFSQGDSNYEFSTRMWQIGVQRKFFDFFGSWWGSLAFSQEFFSLKNTDQIEFDLQPKRAPNNALVFLVRYQFGDS